MPDTTTRATCVSCGRTREVMAAYGETEQPVCSRVCAEALFRRTPGHPLFNEQVSLYDSDLAYWQAHVEQTRRDTLNPAEWGALDAEIDRIRYMRRFTPAFAGVFTQRMVDDLFAAADLNTEMAKMVNMGRIAAGPGAAEEFTRAAGRLLAIMRLISELVPKKGGDI